MVPAALVVVGLVSCGGSSATPTTTIPVATSSTSAAPTVTSTSVFTTTTTLAANGGIEYVLSGGLIVTMDPAMPEVEALLVRDGLVVFAGSEADVTAAAGPSAIAIPLEGRVVFPGFIDSHTHRLTQRWKWDFSEVEEASQQALSEGWVSLAELAVTPDDFATLLEAAERDRLPIRVNAYLTFNGFAGEELDPWYRGFEPGQQFGNLRIAGIKIFIDFDSGRTLLFSGEDLTRIVTELRAEGWQVTVKAIGLQSHDLAITAYSSAGVSVSDRFRIEHSIAVTDEHLAQMAAMGVIASIQPAFPGAIWHEEDLRDLAEELGREHMFRWPDYLTAGVPLVGSPYNPDGVNEELTDPSHMSPMGLLHRSVTQIGLGGATPEPWMLDRRLDREAILAMLTTEGTYATFEESSRGTLMPGMAADLVVLSADPRTVPDEDLRSIEVLMTMIEGEPVFCRDETLCP